MNYRQHAAPARRVFLAGIVSLALTAAGVPVFAQDRRLRNKDRELIAAAGRGNVATVRQLIKDGANVRIANDDGETALIAAAYKNHMDIAKLLVAAGADVNHQDRTQQSAYLISTSDGYVELLRLTLANGADVHSTDSYNGTGLIRAADRGYFEIIRELLKTPIKLDHINRLGWTALLEAIILGSGDPAHTESVRLLVAAGANVNLADHDGITPLAHARRNGYAAMVAILQRAGGR